MERRHRDRQGLPRPAVAVEEHRAAAVHASASARNGCGFHQLLKSAHLGSIRRRQPPVPQRQAIVPLEQRLGVPTHIHYHAVAATFRRNRACGEDLSTLPGLMLRKEIT